MIIDYLHARQPAVGFVQRLAEEGVALCTTSLNVTEVLRGALASGKEKAHSAALDVLRGLREVPFGPRAARRCADLLASLDRAGRPMPILDAMIASIALDSASPVVTRNVKDFGAVEGLTVVQPE